jgi:hypothetical protein
MCYLLTAHTYNHIVGLFIKQELSPVDFCRLFRNVVPDESTILASERLQVLQALPQILIFQLHLMHLDLVVLYLVLLPRQLLL